MGQTVREIEAHIGNARLRLGSDLQELERKVDAAIDWRAHFRAKPYASLGLAFVVGLAASKLLHSSTDRQRDEFTRSRAIGPPPNWSTESQKYQALEMWDHIKGALIGLAAARIKDYITQLVPGFDEQFQRTQQTSRRTHNA